MIYFYPVGSGAGTLRGDKGLGGGGGGGQALFVINGLPPPQSLFARSVPAPLPVGIVPCGELSQNRYSDRTCACQWYPLTVTMYDIIPTSNTVI